LLQPLWPLPAIPEESGSTIGVNLGIPVGARAAARSAGRTVRRKSTPLRELFAPRCRLAAYFNWVEIDENVLLSLVPRQLTTAMIAMEIPAAIKPNSIAVAPDSSLRKALSVCAIARRRLSFCCSGRKKAPADVQFSRGKDLYGRGKPAARPRIRIGLASDRLTVLATPWRRVADVQFSGAVVPGGPCLVFLRHAPQLAGNLRSAREPSLTRTHSSEFD
jgi:hypothetical protein